MSCPTLTRRLVSFREAVSRIRYGERAILLRRDFDPVGRPVMHWRRGRARTGWRGGYWGNRDRRLLIVDGVSDKQPRYRVFLPTEHGEVDLPEILEAG